MAAYRRVDGLIHLRLAACTLGSAPGPALGNKYGKLHLLPYLFDVSARSLHSIYSAGRDARPQIDTRADRGCVFARAAGTPNWNDRKTARL